MYSSRIIIAGLVVTLLIVIWSKVLETIIEKYTWLVNIGLICLYIAHNVPDILIVTNMYSINLPLNFLYFSKLLFSGNGLNPEIAGTMATPANASVIYPVGIYVISRIMGSVRNILLFTFMAQAIIPVFIFKLFGSITGKPLALVLAILSVNYAISNAIGVRPDLIIQPVMLVAMICLYKKGEQERLKPKALVIVGILTSVIIVLKHNIGIFFVALCGTILFFRSFTSSTGDRKRNDSVVYSLVAVYVLFGLVFMVRLPHFDEIIYFLLPYYGYWILVCMYYRGNKSIVFNSINYAKDAMIYASVSMALPVIMFVWIGSVYGYEKYWHALFNMGYEFIKFWDYGILGIMKSYNRLGTSLYVALPFVVNVIVCFRIFHLVVFRKNDAIQKRNYLEIGSVTIIGILMYFPLEDILIAISKSFLGIMVLAMLLMKGFDTLGISDGIGGVCSRIGQNCRRVSMGTITPNVIWYVLAWVLVLGQLVSFFPRLSYAMSLPVSHGMPEVEAAVGMPIHSELAEQLNRQTEVIKRAVHGNPYYVVEDSGGTLMGLATIVDNKFSQYYVRMDKDILNEEVARAIVSSVAQVPYVVVQADLYERYLMKKSTDAAMNEILGNIEKNYIKVDEYEAPMKRSPFVADIYSFIVLKSR